MQGVYFMDTEFVFFQQQCIEWEKLRWAYVMHHWSLGISMETLGNLSTSCCSVCNLCSLNMAKNVCFSSSTVYLRSVLLIRKSARKIIILCEAFIQRVKRNFLVPLLPLFARFLFCSVFQLSEEFNRRKTVRFVLTPSYQTKAFRVLSQSDS